MGREKHNLIGMKIATLTVIRSLGSNKHGQQHWEVMCGKCGKSYAIAGYNLTHGNIHMCRYCYHDRLRKISDNDIKEIFKLLNDGKTYKEIGKLYNVSQSTIHRRVKKYLSQL
jgi:hypothetical protein